MDKDEENKQTEKPHVNRETLDAIAEGHRLANDPNAPAYHDMESLIQALESQSFTARHVPFPLFLNGFT